MVIPTPSQKIRVVALLARAKLCRAYWSKLYRAHWTRFLQVSHPLRIVAIGRLTLTPGGVCSVSTFVNSETQGLTLIAASFFEITAEASVS